MLTGELKAICIKHLQEYVKAFQEKRTAATDEVVERFMARRPLNWKGNPKVERVVPVMDNAGKGEEGGAGGDGKMTKNQLKKLEKEKMVAAKKAAKQKEKEDAAAAKQAA